MLCICIEQEADLGPGFDQFENEADVGYWTGILGACYAALPLHSIDLRMIVSTFFLTQFLTSLLWVSILAKYIRPSDRII